jgi:hypothetical protein
MMVYVSNYSVHLFLLITVCIYMDPNPSTNQDFIITRDMSHRRYNMRQHITKDKNKKKSPKLVQAVYTETLSKQGFSNSRQWKFMSTSKQVAVNTHLWQQLI